MNPPTEATWIKRSEREPTLSQFPIWAFDNNTGFKGAFYLEVPVRADYTHWMPVKLPLPPQPERKSFEQQDYEASNKWAKGKGSPSGASYFHEGANHVRAQVRAVLNKPPVTHEAIRALVEEEAP